MSSLLDLIADNQSAAGLAVTSVVIVVGALLLRWAAAPLMRRRFHDDPYRRYWSVKLVSYAITALAVILFIALWAPLGGQLSVVLGFATAGVAFAMREVIGSLFGWLNILLGRIYTVGDRIEIAGVRGDVMDITPLRTKILEIGSDPELTETPTSWIGARQPTGRVVAVSNLKSFTDPVFNYSAHFEWVWEELTITVSQDADWRRAEEILLDCVREHEPQRRKSGEEALARLAERYLVSRAEVEPRTFVRLADGDVDLIGRFVTPVRSSRAAKDAILRRAMGRMQDEGIALAYPTYSVQGAVVVEPSDPDANAER